MMILATPLKVRTKVGSQIFTRSYLSVTPSHVDDGFLLSVQSLVEGQLRTILSVDLREID
jgi:hypothetical protein